MSCTIGGNHCFFVHLSIDLHSKYPAGLDSEPELADLMNEVAAEIPSKWRHVGQQLGLEKSLLDGLGQGDTNHYYSNVFTLWKKRNLARYPYTWQTVLHTLNTPAVGEHRVANDIKNKLTGRQTWQLQQHKFVHVALRNTTTTCLYVLVSVCVSMYGIKKMPKLETGTNRSRDNYVLPYLSSPPSVVVLLQQTSTLSSYITWLLIAVTIPLALTVASLATLLAIHLPLSFMVACGCCKHQSTNQSNRQRT